MKSKHLLHLFLLIILACTFPVSCKDNKTADLPEIVVPVAEAEQGIDEAMWDLYSKEPLMSFAQNFTENDKAELSKEWDSAEVFCLLTQGWSQTSDYLFDGTLSTRYHLPYTLTITTDVKKTLEEKEMSQNIQTYIFLEHDTQNNSFSVCGAYDKTVRKNGFYETLENTVMSKEHTENFFTEKLSRLGAQDIPATHELTEDTQPQTTVRRYNHKPVNAEEMRLSAFPDSTILDILSRFDDAYGELFGSHTDSSQENEYSLISFDYYPEYGWQSSKRLDEFTDRTDNTQPYTYCAVYNVEDQNGISLVARLDVFTEIEPNKPSLRLIESVFSITYAGQLLFEDIHDVDETVILLDTIVKYHPEDVVVTPTTEEVAELLEAQQAEEVVQQTEEVQETDSQEETETENT